MAYALTTLAELTSQLTERLGENSTFWTSEEKRDAINEAICVWQAISGQWVGQLQVSPVYTDENFTPAPMQLVSTQRIATLAGSPLVPTSMQELDQGMGDWQGSGTAALWAPAGINHVAMAPAPTDALVFHGMTTPPRLTLDIDYIDLGQEDLNSILDYAQWYLTFKEGPTETLDMDPGFDSLVKAATERNGAFKSTAFYRKYMGKDRNAVLRPTEVKDKAGAR